MLPADLVLLVALTVFAVVWCARTLPFRRHLLILSAATAMVAGLYDACDDRWQAGIGAGVGVVFLLLALFGRKLPRLRSIVVVVLLVALAAAAILLFPITPLPKPSGPYAIGVRDFVLTDTTRRGLLGAAPDQPRRLPVRVWYPATPAPGTKPRFYFNEREVQTTAHGFGTLFGFPPFLDYLRHVRTNAYENAPLIAGAQRLPTVFFSHGYTAYAAADSVLIEELASHGYVVYAVEHSGDASPMPLPDGTVIPSDPAMIEHIRALYAHGLSAARVRGFTARDFDQRLDGQLQGVMQMSPPDDHGIVVSAPVWLADRLFVHDALQAGRVPASVAGIAVASELAHTGEMGISFGGSTSGAVCMVDPRCAAVVNLDGGDFDLAPFDADLPAPLLMFHADLDGFYRMMGVEPYAGERSFNDFSYERFEHAGLRGDIYRMMLKGSVHAGLTDSALFMRRPLRDALLGTAPTDVLIGAPNAFVLGFFDKYLRHLDNGFPQAQYRRYAGWVVPYDNSPVRKWWLAKPQAERAALERRIAAMKEKLRQERANGR